MDEAGEIIRFARIATVCAALHYGVPQQMSERGQRERGKEEEREEERVVNSPMSSSAAVSPGTEKRK